MYRNEIFQNYIVYIIHVCCYNTSKMIKTLLIYIRSINSIEQSTANVLCTLKHDMRSLFQIKIYERLGWSVIY